MAELVSLQRLVADGYHNAFTDLILWHGQYYLGYRTAQGHGIEPPGDVIIMRSVDLAHWQQVVRFDTGGDDRDPKLLDAGDRLAVTFGTWVPRWRSTGSLTDVQHDLLTHISVSRDGSSWSTPRQMYGANYWLWRLVGADGAWWCAAYHFGRRDDRDMRTVHLLRSEDLFDWRLVAQIRSGGGPGEPVLYAPAPDTLHAVIRTLQPDHHSWLGISNAPYDNWRWHDLGVMIHAPVVLPLPGDRWIVAGRSRQQDLPADSFDAGEQQGPAGHPTGAGTSARASVRASVWEIKDTAVQHLLTVPSAGDCSYCGLAPGTIAPDPAASSRGAAVLMSYYSQHDRLPLPGEPPTPSDVYLASMIL